MPVLTLDHDQIPPQVSQVSAETIIDVQAVYRAAIVMTTSKA